MTLPTSQNNQSAANNTDFLLRASRRGLFIVLLMILAFGATLLGAAVWPDSVLGTWPMRLPWLLPILVVMLGFGGRLLARGRAWDPNSLEVKQMEQDEFRRMNFSRAQRAALGLVLILQIPLGLLFAHLSGTRAVIAMGVSTITLGMVVLIALFLFFDRD
jgi:hypothetical protein